MIEKAATLFWVGSAVPLLLAILLRRTAPPCALAVGAAFAVSFAGDLLSATTGLPWRSSYLWLPPQMGLAIYALTLGRRSLMAWSAVLGFAMSYDVLVQGTGPDWLITGLGSAGVVALALTKRSPVRAPLLLYFGAGSALYFGMMQHLGDPLFVPWWWAYQGARVLAWTSFAAVLVHSRLVIGPRRREPVPFGPLELLEAV